MLENWVVATEKSDCRLLCDYVDSRYTDRRVEEKKEHFTPIIHWLFVQDKCSCDNLKYNKECWESRADFCLIVYCHCLINQVKLHESSSNNYQSIHICRHHLGPILKTNLDQVPPHERIINAAHQTSSICWEYHRHLQNRLKVPELLSVWPIDLYRLNNIFKWSFFFSFLKIKVSYLALEEFRCHLADNHWRPSNHVKD